MVGGSTYHVPMLVYLPRAHDGVGHPGDEEGDHVDHRHPGGGGPYTIHSSMLWYTGTYHSCFSSWSLNKAIWRAEHGL